MVKHRKLTEAEVYFGWSLPHPAAPGSYVGSDASALSRSG
jgi:hypothetical protein